MNKRIIFASMLLVLSLGLMSFARRGDNNRAEREGDNTTAVAQDNTYKYEVSAKAIQKCNIIVAYHFNRYSLRDDQNPNIKKFFEKNSCPDEMTWAAIDDTVKDQKNKNLISDIKGLNPSQNGKNDVIAYYSDSNTYKNEDLAYIYAFFNSQDKNKNSKLREEVIPLIKTDIENFLNLDDKRCKAEWDKKNKGNGGGTGGSGEKKDIELLALLGVLLGLIGTGLGGYCFWQMRKMQETIRKQKGRVKELREQVGEMESMKTAINGIKSNLSNLQNEMDERLKQINRNSMRSAEAPRNTHQATQQAAPQRPTAPAAPAEPQVLYAGLPSGDVFADAKAQNSPKSFYKIELRGGNVGEYEFISNPTTINYAKSSTTNFIECACNIVENANGFNNVITTRKGRVEKSGNDWKIVQKAEVRLS